MEYLDNIGEKVGLGNVDLDNIKRQASFYLRDKFKSARLLLTDVTPSQLLAEEATNDDEWGPATKTMAAISDACRRADECPRIMLVLHSRLALIGKKHWRQFLKTLTVVEFLLFHGPEQLGMEFSSDRDLIEDLTRFNYVSERGVDHGLVVRKKAKQVLKLLMEDDYLKEERARAQKLTKSIFGQGSYQSSNSSSGTSRYGGFGNTSSSSASTGLMHDDDTDEYHSDKKFTAFEERILSEKRGSRTEKTKNGNGESTTNDWRAFDDDTGSFISNQNAAESNWADFSNTSPERSPKFDSLSPFARQNEILEEESFSPRSPASIGKSSVQNSPKLPQSSPKLPVKVVKEEPKPKGKSKLKVRNYALSTSASGDFKLPPPPPPPGGSKVTIVKSVSAPPAGQPDLLDLSFDASNPHREESLLNFGTPSKAAAGSDQAVMDLLGMTSSTTSVPSEFDFLNNNNTSGNNKVPETRSPGLVPDIFDLGSNSTTADSGSLPVNTGDSVKDKGPFGGFNFLNFNNESSTTGSEQDFFGTGVASAAPKSSTTGSEYDFFGTGVANAASNTTGSEQDFFGTGVASAAPNSSTVNNSDLFVSERSSTGSGAATGLPEVVPADVFDAIAPDFASFGLRDTGRKPVAKPADDDLFNLLS